MKPLVPPDPPLAADGVRLRLFEYKDAPAIVSACNDPSISEFLPVPSPYSDEDARAYVASLPAGWESGEAAQFAAVDERDRLLASCGLVTINHQMRVTEVGYWVVPWERGRGIATTVTRLLSRWALTDLDFDRVELYAARENTPSRRVAVKAGFTEEGTLRERELTRDGRRRDLVAYGLLRREVPAPW